MRKVAAFSLLLGLALVISACATYAGTTIYVDTSGINARKDLTKEQKEEVIAAMLQEIKANLEYPLGTGNVTVTDDPDKKDTADRTVTTMSTTGLVLNDDGTTLGWRWGFWPGGSNTEVYVDTYMDDPPGKSDAFKKPDGSWDTVKLGTAMGTTAAHEIAHSYSVSHDDTNTNKMSSASIGSDIAGGLGFNAPATKTLQENNGKPPCPPETDHSMVACLADWWSDPTFPVGYLPNEPFSITTSFVFSGPLATMFDFGWWGIDTDNGAIDGNTWGDFVHKSSMTGTSQDANRITFFDGWTAHFLLRGRPNTPYQGLYFTVSPTAVLLSDWVTRPDASQVARHINASWNVNGVPGPDVMVSLDTNVYGAGTPPFSGFRLGVAPPISIPEAKQRVEGSTVCIAGNVVTAAFQGCFYVEDPDRYSGIRVNWSAPANPGSTAFVVGKVQTNAGGEREIQATTVQPSGGLAPGPLGMVNRAVGGGDFRYVECKWPSGQQGVTGGVGLNNIGLYVRVFGRVKQTDPSPNPEWFTIDDGSGVGLKVACGPVPILPADDTYVIVSGISSCEMPVPADRPTRLLRATNWQPVTEP